jgi:hypothetical protein
MTVSVMKKNLLCLAILLWQPAFAQVAPFMYRLANVPVTEDSHKIVIGVTPPLTVRIRPGGHTWPSLSLDEQGNLFAGDRVVEADRTRDATAQSVQGKGESTIALPHGYGVIALAQGYRIARASASCTFSSTQLGLAGNKTPLQALQDGNVVFRASESKVMALATRLGADNSQTRYAIADIDLTDCRVRNTKLGNPDLLVELNWSPGGGWWVTGSIEQTLLRSTDGMHWRPLRLPESVSSLTSAYIVNERDIWLAASLPDAGDHDPLIVHSIDGGKTWKNVTRADAVLAHMPKGWLEGQRRLGTPVAR